MCVNHWFLDKKTRIYMKKKFKIFLKEGQVAALESFILYLLGQYLLRLMKFELDISELCSRINEQPTLL